MGFIKDINAHAKTRGRPRSAVYVAYDQLNLQLGALAQASPDDSAVIMIESSAKAGRRPYHKQKLATVLANQRHFAKELQAAGFCIDYIATDGSYKDALEDALERYEYISATEPAERELRVEMEPLRERDEFHFVLHDGWLTTKEDFKQNAGRPFRMDKFYRGVRKRYDILMESGKPIGGKYSFDADNRSAWKEGRDPKLPTTPTFAKDSIKTEVVELIEERYADHPGELHMELIAASAEDVEQVFERFFTECFALFGTYEDAMTVQSATLFHSLLSPLINNHRILPSRALKAALNVDAPFNAKEGYIRQLIGWREFVKHVHDVTDGFRKCDVPSETEGTREDQGGARPSFLGAANTLPPAYWGTQKSGLACLDDNVATVVETGYSHHITRLMVLSNIANLLDVSPRELTDWFWEMYIDAYDWVVEPNVLAMGTYAVGDLMTTKPYISGAAYISRMSDHCKSCAFHPKKTCPLTRMYWAYLDRHGNVLEDNFRLKMPMRSLARRTDEQKAEDRRVYEIASTTLAKGERLAPALLT